jgi:hypothetical protein
MATNNSWNNQITAAKSAITLNSGTNTVNISSDASATTVNVGTGASAKTVNVGSTNTTSSLIVRTGSGGMFASGIAGVSVSNKNYMTINTSTGALGSDAGPASGALTLVQTQTASASANLSFTTGISSTFGTYQVIFRDIQAGGGGSIFEMLLSTDGGSSYLSSTYQSGNEQNSWNGAGWTNFNSTTYGRLMDFAGGRASGYLFISNLATSSNASWVGRYFVGNVNYITYGTCTTTGINALRFQLNSGTITSGTISLYSIAN